MSRIRKILGTLLFFSCLSGTLLLGVQATTGNGAEKSPAGAKTTLKGVIVTEEDLLYEKECGSCHFPYQPWWLPERSWEKLMSGLQNHFGESAELTPATQQQLTGWLRNHAAEHSTIGRARGMLRSIKADATPLRITESGYFRRKHHELPRQVWQENPAVRSLARCDACHPRAELGSFNEHEVKIPGVGRWDD
ncbi:MAG: diheme cytochrome c [Magnetococcales bacterium]|nr:diheme cytochrome c [Magnetococcales bacterium]